MNNNHESLDFSQHPERSEDEWKSLIQGGVMGTDFKPTEEFLNSEIGKQAQAEDEKLYRNAEIIQKRLSNIDEQVSSGHMTEEEAAKLRERLIAKREQMLDDAIEQTESDYQVYADSVASEGKDMSEWVDSPEVQHLSREEIEKLGAAAMQAANVGPVTEPPVPDVTAAQAAPQNQEQAQPDNAQPNPEPQPQVPHKIELLAQQLDAGKASSLADDPELYRGVLRRIQQDLVKQQSTDQSAQQSMNQATQNSVDQAGNQSPITLSPELTQAMNDRAQEFAKWRDQGIISDSQYDNFIESNKAEFYARQKSADAATQTTADRARQAAKDKANQQAKDKAAQQARDRDANSAGDQGQDKDKDKVSRAEHFKERFSKLPGAKKFMIAAGVAAGSLALVGALIFGGANAVNAMNQNGNDTSASTPAAAASANSESTTLQDFMDQINSKINAAEMEAALAGGETAEAAKITYDYSEWSDFEHKLGQFNYGYDCSDDHGNVEAMKANMHKKADQAPQILSDYAFELLSITELHNLGIVQMSPTSLSDYISNSDNPGSVETYQKVKEAVHNAIDDSDFTFKTKTGPSFSTFMYGSDENGDGELTPNEMHLGYSQVNRVNAKQVGVHRTLGMEEIDATFNEDCGLQSDHDVAPENMTHLSEDEVTKTTPNDHNKGTPDDGTPEKEKTPPGDDEPEDKTPPGDDEPSGEEPSDDEPEGDEPSDDTPQEEVEKKDGKNLERIDEANEQNMAENNGSQTVNNYENPGVGQDEITEAPAAESYGGTEANISQNDSAPAADTTSDQGHSTDAGGAHDNEYQGRQADDAAQQAANDRGDTESVPTIDELDQMTQNLRQNQN